MKNPTSTGKNCTNIRGRRLPVDPAIFITIENQGTGISL
jgi:hypothetical protein